MGFGEEFLTDPALFPARMAGTEAGCERLIVDLPGGPYEVAGLSQAQHGALTARYGERCLEEPAHDAVVRIAAYDADAGEFLTVERDGKLNRFDFAYHEHAVHMTGNRMMAQVSWRPALVAALWTPIDGGDGFLEVFENFFRTVVAYRLLELGGAVLHSAGIADGDRVWLFCGPSGAGKTTIARSSLASGRTVLSDDINAIYLDGDVPVVAKMPFAGELGHSNERVGPFPLAGVNSLEQAHETSWRPLSRAAAVATLLTCSPFLNHDPHRLPRLMHNLEAIAAQARAGVLSFSLDGDFWPFLEGSTT